MGVALQAALGVAVSLLIAGEVPDDQGLVARARQQHVGAKSRFQSQSLNLICEISEQLALTSPERWLGR